MPYLIPPRKSPENGFQDYVWYQKATATKPAAFVLEIWDGYPIKQIATAAQKKKWDAFKFPKKSVSSVRKTVAAYKKKGYVVVTDEDIAKLFKEYVPRSYAAALKSKKIDPKSKYSFIKDGSDWAGTYAPMANIWDKPSVVSVYNQFLKSMTWGGKKPKNSPKSPASYFWGWGRPLDFSGYRSVIPLAYGSDTVMLHNYKTGKVAVVTDCEGDDDEAGEYAMSAVAFEWKMNPKLVSAMNKPIMSGKGQQYVMKGTGRGVKKPAAKPKPKAKPKAKAPKSKGFNYISSESGWLKSGTRTIEKITKQYQQDGWKKLTHRAKIGSQIWNRIGKSPEYKSWVQKLSQMDNNSYDALLSDDLYYMENSFEINGDFHSPHFGEDGDYEILTKGNKILLLFYIGDFDYPVCTPLMKKTFTMPTKPVAKAKPKATKKSTAKAKPKAKPKTKYVLGKKDRPTDVKKRKSPPYSAKQFPKGARKKGNNGKMWTIVTDKRNVKRWKA
jgi:hypothetical protein